MSFLLRNGFHRASVYRAMKHDLTVVFGDTNSRLVVDLPEGEMPKGPPEAWLLCDELNLGEINWETIGKHILYVKNRSLFFQELHFISSRVLHFWIGSILPCFFFPWFFPLRILVFQQTYPRITARGSRSARSMGFREAEVTFPPTYKYIPGGSWMAIPSGGTCVVRCFTGAPNWSLCFFFWPV